MNGTSAELLRQYQSGNPAAAQILFDRYAQRLLALARTRLSSKLARRIDADDVVQSTYRSFFRRAGSGELEADQQGDLWQLLATITLRKLGRQAKRHRAAKRSLDREGATAENAVDSLSTLVAREPSPADVVAAAEELHWLMLQLEPAKRQMVELRMQGSKLDEIAVTIGRSERTVRRWLDEVKQLLEERWPDRAAAERSDDDRHQPPPKDSRFDSDVRLLHSDYRLQRLIGAGGMCKVYVATQTSTGRSVTVKVLRKRLRRQQSMIERFLNEARIVARFSHPHIVPVHGLGRLPGGGYFMVMDYIDGENLLQTCARAPFEFERAAEIVAIVANAISHAHDQGVIHRDLTPGNVLLNRQGQVFVTDFGFACLYGDDRSGNDAIAGTAGFIAPEQIDRRWGEIGPRTDVYGLGALLHFLLCGRPPFDGATVSEVLDQVVLQPDCPWLENFPQDIPPALRTICEMCLQKDGTVRFATAREVAAALAQFRASAAHHITDQTKRQSMQQFRPCQ